MQLYPGSFVFLLLRNVALVVHPVRFSFDHLEKPSLRRNSSCISSYNVLNATASPVLSGAPYHLSSVLVGTAYLSPVIAAGLAALWSGWWPISWRCFLPAATMAFESLSNDCETSPSLALCVLLAFFCGMLVLRKMCTGLD
jgi:hypothetical protein